MTTAKYFHGKTLLNRKQQHDYVSRKNVVFEYKWSNRGLGNSKIIMYNTVAAKTGGRGYDRFGKALGDLIMQLFPNEVYKIAVKYRDKKARRTCQDCEKFYGLFYNVETKKAWLDGSCGDSSMRLILNKIGFKLRYVGGIDKGLTGSHFYVIEPFHK